MRIKSRASATYRRNCPSRFMINGAIDMACTTRKRLASRRCSWVRLSFWRCVMRLKRRWRIVAINQCTFTHPPPSPTFEWRWTMSVPSGLNLPRLTTIKSRGVCVRDLIIFCESFLVTINLIRENSTDFDHSSSMHLITPRSIVRHAHCHRLKWSTWHTWSRWWWCTRIRVGLQLENVIFSLTSKMWTDHRFATYFIFYLPLGCSRETWKNSMWNWCLLNWYREFIFHNSAPSLFLFLLIRLYSCSR